MAVTPPTLWRRLTPLKATLIWRFLTAKISLCVTLAGTPATVSRSVPLVLRSVLKSPATACPVAQPGHLLSPMTKKWVTCTELPNLIASTSSSAIGSPVSDVFYPPSLEDSSIINEGTEDDNEED